jgi:hypothetical protein
MNSVLYNPHAALVLMEASRPGMARAFFDQWFKAINNPKHLPRVHDKKLSIMALCALLEMDPVNILPSLSDGWPGIVAGIIKLFKDLPGAIQSGYTQLREFGFVIDEDPYNRPEGARRGIGRAIG